ncbi:chitin deacetylase [Physocladia obscura]|uniref:Chitin deacetylase n=1 Tax=Physocladia obscura TaxID=109957 RepID=A0AAD5T9Q2_9FUNG|nr:chitin deacetylase [Physocladia obscura]
MATPDTYASYRVPEPPVVPKWTAFVKSLSNETEYPWINVAPSPSTNDGGATGGAANGVGAAWGTVANAATEVFSCPTGFWALSFDDGPVLTDQAMALLKTNGVVGTFFLIGSNVVNNATHAKFVQDLYNAGHQIALHTWTHRQISLQSTDEVISELIFNILSIYNVIGKVPRYFRPPYSAIDDRVRYILHSMGLRPVIWNIETLDAEIVTPPQQAPFGIDIAGQNLTVPLSIQHTENSFNQKYDPRWNYFPSSTQIGTTGRYTYDGFISLEHETTNTEIQVAQAIVPFAFQSGLKSVYVNECDQILPNASFYLDDNSLLVQFIKNINLPLTDADYAAFSGFFPANPAGGSSINGAPTTTDGSSSVFSGSGSKSSSGSGSSPTSFTTPTANSGSVHYPSEGKKRKQ